MKTHIKFTLAMAFLTFMFSSLSRADLFIDSVYPNVGKVGEDLIVTIRGGGFDEHTRVFISPDYGNRGRIVGSVDTFCIANAVAVVDQTVYVADGPDGLHVIDVSDPQNPTIVGSVLTSGGTGGVAVADQTAYLANGRGGLQVVRCERPSKSLHCRFRWVRPGDARGVAVASQTAYVADGDYGLQVVDVSDPQNPAIVGSLDTPRQCQTRLRAWPDRICGGWRLRLASCRCERPSKSFYCRFGEYT